MNFTVDDQTRGDLNLFSKNENCIFRYYNYTNTFQGKILLREQLKSPGADRNLISKRIEALRYLMSIKPGYEVLQKDVEYVEHYLRLKRKPLQDHPLDALKDFLKNKFQATNDYYIIGKGIESIFKLVHYIQRSFLYEQNATLSQSLLTIKDSFDTLQIKEKADHYATSKKAKLGFRSINHLDSFFRDKYIKELKQFMRAVYELDVLFSLMRAMEKNGFTIPEFSYDTNETFLSLEGIYNPLVQNPVKNTIELAGTDNCCFLTGPNMSGKSTFLKSVGLCIYLAHLGFPIPAKKMKLSLFDGLITTINLSDNLNLGYSHYYGEVQRIKQVAQHLEQRKKMVILIDEIFRGTNVEEAKYGTHLITAAFSKIKKSVFMVSSHIVEVAETLKTNVKGIKYYHLGIANETDLESYTYQIQPGVSHQKLGKKILEQEGVVELLERAAIKS